MEKIVIYCKSYRKDLERVKKLYESICEYNVDSIPFYVSVPKKDIELFTTLGLPNLIPDEEISNTTEQGWESQQIIKSSFWKLNIAHNYICIDSDSYFIRPFFISDFIAEGVTPYTVVHEQKELFSWTVTRAQTLGFDPKESFIQDRKKVMQVFDREGKFYDFGPSPTIWSAKVWESLEQNYITPNNLTFADLIKHSPSEFSWYGEALLRFKAVEIFPIEPLFKVFHYPLQYLEYKHQNITQQMISQNYLGIVMQSNFNSPLNY